MGISFEVTTNAGKLRVEKQGELYFISWSGEGEIEITERVYTALRDGLVEHVIEVEDLNVPDDSLELPTGYCRTARDKQGNLHVCKVIKEMVKGGQHAVYINKQGVEVKRQPLYKYEDAIKRRISRRQSAAEKKRAAADKATHE